MSRCAKTTVGLLLLCLMFAGRADAKVGVTDNLSLSGWGWVTAGQFHSSFLDSGSNDADFDEAFTEDIHVGLKLEYNPNDVWTVTLHAGGFLQHASGIWNYPGVKVGKLLKTYLIQASVHADFGDEDRYPLFFDFGYFPLKYNADSRNLGEYLFRSGTYPPYVSSGFELADKVKGLGLRLGSTLFGGLTQEALITSETDMYPFYDFSLSYLLRYRPSDIFEIGAGIMASRLISVDEEATTPAEGYEEYELMTPEFNYGGVVDPETGDTVFLTFRGTKAALHLAVQPLANLESGLLGENDLRLYGEVAVLGFKDYPVWYDKIEERTPAMVGLNLPTHPLMSWGCVAALSLAGALQGDHTQIVIPGSYGATAAWVGTGLLSWALNRWLKIDTWLDLLALEVEYYGSPWRNSPQLIVEKRSPAPYTYHQVPEIATIDKLHMDDWKWSLYASKKVGTFLEITGIVANDNMGRGRYGAQYDYPITMYPTDWYWMLRTKFFF